MSCLLRYLFTTGSIQSIWVGNPVSLLEAQIVPDDPDYGYLIHETDLDASLLQERWEVVEGVLQAKEEAVLTPDVTTFAANGVDGCVLTLVPFVPCAVWVNGGGPFELTETDPLLVFTSDVPLVFNVALVPMAGVWAEPILVEAI